jgi:RimJ/RimL family protein N-acetyltransferase
MEFAGDAGMLGNRAAAGSPAACGKGHHVVLTGHFRMQSPSRSDLLMMRAAASDPEAQRWLGWRQGLVKRESRRQDLLRARPGRGRTRDPGMATGSPNLVVIDLATGLLAGGVGLDGPRGELGGWLSPQFRGRGLGAELFAGAAQFAHYHLGHASVRAGTERANLACVGALRSAGFTPTSGPEVYRLPDGRAVPTRWFRHVADAPATCGS